MTQVTSYHWEVTPSGCMDQQTLGGWLVVEPTHLKKSEKYAQVQLDQFPKVKNQNMFELPPPGISSIESMPNWSETHSVAFCEEIATGP